MRSLRTDSLLPCNALSWAGRRAAILLLVLAATLRPSPPQAWAQNPKHGAPGFVNVLPQHDVLTQHYDNFRTGLNNTEFSLTPANVNVRTFGKLFTRRVDGQIYAQPLYVSHLQMGDGTTHNVVFICTQHNSVYAFDADDPAQSEPLWKVNLGQSLATDIVQRDFSVQAGLPYNCPDVEPEYGIQGTPVIDSHTGTLYLVAKTVEHLPFRVDYFQRVHALDITTGEEKFGGPVEIQAVVPGFGGGSFGGILPFDPKIQKNTPGAALVNGVVYFAWASHCDLYFGQYHGWVLGFDAAHLERGVIKAFNTSPDGSANGIWAGGKAPAIDEQGNLYLETGNGSVSAPGGGRDYGEAFVKLSTAGSNLNVADWFIPHHFQRLNIRDDDLGASGPMLIPRTNLMIGGGKDGILYVLDRNNLGHFNPTGDPNDPLNGDNQILQKFRSGNGHLHLAPVYYDGGPGNELIYTWQENDVLRSYRFNRGAVMAPFINPTPTAVATRNMPGHPDGQMTVSSHGTMPNTAIVWAFWHIRDANFTVSPGTLVAYDAMTLRELWNSDQAPGRLDELPSFPKFCAPTVANGKVYAATFSGELEVYGLLPTGTTSQPFVEITQPLDGTTFETGSTVHLCANAFVRGDTIQRVDFYADGNRIGTASAPDPTTGLYCIDWIPPAGNHSIRATVTTQRDATATSRVVRIRVGTVGGTTRIYAVNAGGPDAPPDALSPRPFTADAFFQGGVVEPSTNHPIDRSGIDPDQVAPELVYQTERVFFNDSTYTFPGLAPSAFYRVRLHFAEIYAPFTSAGQRVFNVLINGIPVLTNFDVVREAGGQYKAIVREFVAVANSQGQIVIQLSRGPVDFPKVSGIEIVGAPLTPQITMTAPQNGSTFLAPASVPVSALVQGVTGITFMARNTATGDVRTVGPIATSDLVHTVSASLDNVPTGTYALSATGTDLNGNNVTSTNQVTVRVTSLSNATILSVNFVGGGPLGTPQPMGPNERAGALEVPNWNNAPGNTGTITALKDHTGAATTASVVWNANETWSTRIVDMPGNFRMMKGYLDQNTVTSTVTVTVSNLPISFGAYNVYVYFDADVLIRGIYTIGSQSIVATTAGGSSFQGTFIQATPQNNFTGNYMVFTGVTGRSFILTATPASSVGFRAPINGIQIVAPQ